MGRSVNGGGEVWW